MFTIQSLGNVYQRYRTLFVSIHNGLAILGLIAILASFGFGGRFISALGKGTNSVIGTIRYEGIVSPEESNLGETPTVAKTRFLAAYLSRRYRIATDATEQLVRAAQTAAAKTNLDPILILAVMAVESRFNPIAESEMGAKGLMQVIPEHHQDKLWQHGGEDAVLDPATNILIGARILKEYIRRTGSPEAGLQLYAGAQSDATNQYAQKVMAERDRIAQALRRDQQAARMPVAGTAPLL